jgi:hypothetical protein
MMKRKIMSVACTEKRPLNCSVLTNCIPGFASSARMYIAIRPATTKKTNVVTTYWTPITLWSVLTRK